MESNETEEKSNLHDEQNDKDLVLLYIDETEQRIAAKDVLRKQNQNVQNCYPPDEYFSKLDSNLKKNTTFVKKLKIFSATQLDSLLKDLQTLNLTKYISEVAAALTEAKLKMTDIQAAIHLCSILHQTYSEFSQHFLDNWTKILNFKPGDKIANPSKLRVDLRFYAELISAGVFLNKGLPLLGSALQFLINMDKEEHCNLSVILSFCKHCGEDYAGLIPRKIRSLAQKYNLEIPRSDLLTPEKQANVRALLKDYYTSLCKHVLNDYNEIQNFQNQNKRILQTKGELSNERRDRLEMLQNQFDKLMLATQNFAEILDEHLPVLPEEKVDKEDEIGVTITLNDSEETNIPSEIWDDEETKRFYIDLLDLNVFLPNCVKTIAEPTETITEEQLDSDDVIDFEQEEISNPEEVIEEEVEPVTTNISNKILLDAFLNNLPNCVNREMIDSSVVEFIMNLNTKHNRRKLIRTLFGVNRTRLDLLPFYARFTATLYTVIPEIGTELCQMLKQDFKYHVRKKDQINIESKIKVVRYIGELVKFNLYSKIEALYFLKVLLHDFNHHHIEMACNLLEVCGRYLFCHKDSHQRTKVYLQQMMRKKSVMALDSRYVTQIENAYYFVNPPENMGITKKIRPVLHEFIRKVLYQELQKNNTDKILRLMRKLDWENDEVAAYAVKCLTFAHNVKYLNIRCLASLLAGLVAYQEFVGTQVIDGVLEDIRVGMEINHPKLNQRRVAMVKYLGELYNYRLIESGDIFKVLYSLITFGVVLDYNVISPLDPPDHLFRIRLTCVLLDTCGQYFNGGSSKKKLDYFLTFFQNYYLFKKEDPIWTTDNPFPVEVDYMFRDSLRSLRPKINFYSSYKEAQEAVELLRKNFTQHLNIEMEDENSSCDLKTIQEQEENDIVSDTQEHTTTEDESGYPESDIDSDQIEENEVSDLDAADNVIGNKLLHTPPGIGAPTTVKCPEDDEFITALDKMVADNIQDRLRDSVKPTQMDISVPMHIKSGLKKTYQILKEEELALSSPKEINTKQFVLMLRKGHKQQYKSFEAPVDSELALNLRNQEEALREEKERVKRLTLNITERLEEEDYQEMLATQQRPQTSSSNRERRKYQHPKGAPDADLIFGPKKVR